MDPQKHMTPRQATYCAILMSGFLCVATPHAQQLSGSARYPWDSRPAKCFELGIEPVPVCQEQSNWTDFPTTVQRVQSLFVNRDITLLNKAGDELARGGKKFSSNQYEFEAWYLAYTSQLSYVSDDDLSFTEEWCGSAGPNSPSLLVNAIAIWAQAWQARGNGYANTVSPEAWKIFYEKLSKADALMDSASLEIKKSGPWHLLKVQLAYDRKISPSKRDDILKAAIAAWPDSTMLYETPMARSSPVWGGSFELMDGVARAAARATKSLSPAAMYVLVYERAFRGNPRYSLSSSKIDWVLAKQGFRDIEQFGKFSPWIWQNFASLACQMRDRDEAKRLYAIRDTQVEGAKSNENTDPCRAFASGG